MIRARGTDGEVGAFFGVKTSKKIEKCRKKYIPITFGDGILPCMSRDFGKKYASLAEYYLLNSYK